MSSGSSTGRGGQVPAGELSQASYDSARRERRAAPGGVEGRRGRSARPSRRGGRERNRIWTRDASHFTRRKRVAYAIVDVVTRHWIGYLLTSEQTHTQVQLLLARALEDEGLLGEDGLRFEGRSRRADPGRADRQRRGDNHDRHPPVHGADGDRTAPQPARHLDRPSETKSSAFVACRRRRRSRCRHARIARGCTSERSTHRR
jgi:hypothetical protein